LGSLIVSVLPGLLARSIEVIQAWTLRKKEPMKIKGKIAGQTFEIEFGGSPQEIKEIVAQLSKIQKRGLDGDPTTDAPEPDEDKKK